MSCLTPTQRTIRADEIDEKIDELRRALWREADILKLYSLHESSRRLSGV
ncbi:MAG: hypothetical protein WCH57_11415 [Verrucomicrobiota bacterium]